MSEGVHAVLGFFTVKRWSMSNPLRTHTLDEAQETRLVISASQEAGGIPLAREGRRGEPRNSDATATENPLRCEAALHQTLDPSDIASIVPRLKACRGESSEPLETSGETRVGRRCEFPAKFGTAMPDSAECR